MRDTSAALNAVHQLFEHGNADFIDAVLDDDVELRPPTYGKSWRGRVLVGRLLRFAAICLEDLQYTDCVSDGALHILRFEARVGDERVSGVDILRINESGLISTFEIFARPPRGVLAIRDAMGNLVRSNPEVAAMMGL